jgi:hypothetical protein
MILAAVTQVIAADERAKALLCTACLAPFCALR